MQRALQSCRLASEPSLPNDPTVAYADLLSGDALATNLIVLGGPDSNSLTREMLRRAPTTMVFGEPNHHVISFRSHTTGRSYNPSHTAFGQVETDYGVIIRFHNPFAPRYCVLLIFGCYGFGT